MLEPSPKIVTDDKQHDAAAPPAPTPHPDHRVEILRAAAPEGCDLRDLDEQEVFLAGEFAG